jgi:uncharacterized lipoprotein YmbA
MNALEGPRSQSISGSDSLALGVGPVDIAAYIDRPQIVTRVGGNELRVAEFNRWASPIRGEIKRILADNLSTLLSLDHVFIYPWSESAAVKFQVRVDIQQFDGRAGDNVFLQAGWGLLGENGEILLLRKSTYTEQINGEDYSAFVEAAGQALAGLSRDIAATIEAVSKEASYK